MATCQYRPPVGQFNPVVEWAWTSTETNPTSVRVRCAPAVANLNDDNGDGLINNKDIPDIVFHSYYANNNYTNGTLRAVSGDGSGELFTVALNETMPDSNPAIGDIDGDGLPEILTLHENKQVMAFENDGTLKWISTDAVAIGHTFLSVTLADLDRDGTPEILVGGHVFNNDGSTRWIGSAGLGDGTALVANLDLVGDPEVVVGPVAYRSDGQVYWSGFTTYRRWAAIGNFDEDAFPEVVEVGWGYISLLEHDDTVKWGPISLSGLGGRGGPPTVADFDGDGLPEIGVAGKNRYYVLEHDGTVKWQSVTVDESSGITASSVFDFDGDGEAEVAYGDERKLWVFKGLNGTDLFKTPNYSLTHLELPVIVDVDNDNNAEMVVVSNQSSTGLPIGVRVFGDAADTWLNTRKIWNQHTYHITNVNDDATIPAIEANNWETYNNYRQNAMPNALGCTDLDASYIRVDQTDYPESVNILARAGNGGVWHVVPGTKVSYYLGHPDTGTLLGTVDLGRLEAGAYEDVSFTWNTPPSGLQEIYVRVDDDGTGQGSVLESNEDNNLAAASLVIGNAKPIANAGDDQMVYWGQTVQLDGSGSNDGDSDPLTHIWTMTSKPAGSNAQLSDFTAVSPTFEADRPGVYTITLVVHDGTEESEPDTVTIIAQAIAMPDVVGMIQAEAESQITAALLQVVDITRQSSLSIPENQVMTQTPAAETPLPINAGATLTVSSGLPRTIVPAVTWLTRADAESAISAANLILGTITDVYSTTVPEGQVATQSPAAGLSVPIYTNVDLGLSQGPEPITVPDVVGLQRTTAESSLVTAKLAVGTITQIYSTTIPKGQVSDQDPAAGQTVDAGTSINLTVSLGAEPVTVPNVVGLTRTVAESTLLNADLALGAIIEEYNNTIPEHQVLAQDPAAGTSVTPQTPVNLTVSLGPDVVPPQVSITVTPERVPLGQSVTITVTADDNLGVATQTLTVNDVEITLTDHQAEYTPSTVGDYTASFTATDDAGNSAAATADFKAFDPNDVTPPVVHIDAPEDGGQITCPTDIIGAIQDDSLDYWVLQYTPVDSTDWVTITSGDSNMDEAELGPFDPTTLPNGIYEIRHYAVDMAGRSDTDSVTIPVTGFLKPGINKLSFTDLQVPVSGINITVVRSYDSFDKRDKDFGYCWSVAVHDVNLDENRIPGESWYEEETGSFIPNWEIRPEKPHFVVVTYPDGNTDIFELEAEYLDPITKGGWEVILKFNPKYGTTSSLEFLYESIFFYNNGAILDEDGGVLDPKRYLLTTKEGQKLRINQSTGLEKMEDRNGNSITISENGIIHSSGKSITFTRDGHGRITKITDPMGYELLYTYSDNGNLIEVEDQENNISTFTYDGKHNLLDYTDSRGAKAMRIEYDEKGRLISITDANNEKIVIDHDLMSFNSVITNKRGYTTISTYNEKGFMLSYQNQDGAINSYSHDENGNILCETNPLGKSVYFTYDQMKNKLSETDPLGNTWYYNYNDHGQIIKNIDPQDNEVVYEYDTKGNLLKIMDALGNAIKMEYDGNGNLVSEEDPLGNISIWEYDTYGNNIKRIDEMGNEAIYTYDLCGHKSSETRLRTSSNGLIPISNYYYYDKKGNIVRIVDGSGYEIVTEYDENGNKIAIVDKLGRRTEYEYKDDNMLIHKIFPDGTETRKSYDENGNKVSSTDRMGRVTGYSYDAVDRLNEITYPDGGKQRYHYDIAGRWTVMIDENNDRIEIEYDSNDRKTKLIDSSGNELTVAYNSASQIISKTDKMGNVTYFEYDNLNRPIATIFPNSSRTSIEYDELGRKIAEIDANGLRTQFVYNAKGNMIKVIDASGAETTYKYDEVGNRVEQKNPNGYITKMEYNNDGKLVKYTLPLEMSEKYEYDSVGNRASKIDFNGDKTIFE